MTAGVDILQGTTANEQNEDDQVHNPREPPQICALQASTTNISSPGAPVLSIPMMSSVKHAFPQG